VSSATEVEAPLSAGRRKAGCARVVLVAAGQSCLRQARGPRRGGRRLKGCAHGHPGVHGRKRLSMAARATSSRPHRGIVGRESDATGRLGSGGPAALPAAFGARMGRRWCGGGGWAKLSSAQVAARPRRRLAGPGGATGDGPTEHLDRRRQRYPPPDSCSLKTAGLFAVRPAGVGPALPHPKARGRMEARPPVRPAKDSGGPSRSSCSNDVSGPVSGSRTERTGKAPRHRTAGRDRGPCRDLARTAAEPALAEGQRRGLDRRERRRSSCDRDRSHRRPRRGPGGGGRGLRDGKSIEATRLGGGEPKGFFGRSEPAGARDDRRGRGGAFYYA